MSVSTISEETSLDQLRENIRTAEADYQKINGDFDAVAARRVELSREKTKLDSERWRERRLESAFQKQFEVFSLGELDQSEINDIRLEHEKEKARPAELGKMIDTLEIGIRNRQAGVQAATAALQGCRHQFWERVSAEIISRIPEAALEAVRRAYAARNLSGAGLSFESFLKEIFGQPLFGEEAKGVMDQLQSEFLPDVE